VAAIVVALVFSRFGGFGTGPSADATEFAKYAQTVSEIEVPEKTRVVALGEATHGNREFQELKLDVFKVMVEKYGVRAFALEADCGGCETANRYVHGGEGIAAEAAEALVFTIYRTAQIAELLSWMRDYNETAAPGQDLRFYGFDMQSYEHSLAHLLEEAQGLGIDVSKHRDLESEDGRLALYGEVRKEHSRHSMGALTRVLRSIWSTCSNKTTILESSPIRPRALESETATWHKTCYGLSGRKSSAATGASSSPHTTATSSSRAHTDPTRR
jgi:hypothetical protein